MPLSSISILVSKSNFDCASESNLETGAGAGTGISAEGKGGGIRPDSPQQKLFCTGGTPLQGYLKIKSNNYKHHLKISYNIITIIINKLVYDLYLLRE